MFWLLPVFFHVSSLLFWYYQFQQLFMAFHSSDCGHSSLQMRLSVYFSIQFNILPFLGSYVNVIPLVMFAEIYPLFLGICLGHCWKPVKRNNCFKSWSSCFQSGSNCLYKWLIIQVSMIEYFFSFSLFSAFRDWKQPWPSSTLR